MHRWWQWGWQSPRWRVGRTDDWRSWLYRRWMDWLLGQKLVLSFLWASWRGLLKSPFPLTKDFRSWLWLVWQQFWKPIEAGNGSLSLSLGAEVSKCVFPSVVLVIQLKGVKSLKNIWWHRIRGWLLSAGFRGHQTLCWPTPQNMANNRGV